MYEDTNSHHLDLSAAKFSRSASRVVGVGRCGGQLEMASIFEITFFKLAAFDSLQVFIRSFRDLTIHLNLGGHN